MKTPFYNKIKHHLVDETVLRDMTKDMVSEKGISEWGNCPLIVHPPTFTHGDVSIELLSEEIYKTVKANKVKDFIVTFIKPFLYETGIYTIPRLAVGWKGMFRK